MVIRINDRTIEGFIPAEYRYGRHCNGGDHASSEIRKLKKIANVYIMMNLTQGYSRKSGRPKEDLFIFDNHFIIASEPFNHGGFSRILYLITRTFLVLTPLARSIRRGGG